jgi:hypothetical protein
MQWQLINIRKKNPSKHKVVLNRLISALAT